MIKFTIVTCTFQAENVIGRTMESVLHQTFRRVEHLIVDGASRDRTVTLARPYKEQSDAMTNGHEVCVISEPDGGLYDAMNKGIRKAKGDYVVFLNAGDVLPSPTTLEFISRRAGASDDLPGVLFGDTDIVDDAGRFLRHRRLSPPERLTWKSFRRGMLVCHQAFYARTDLARHCPYDLQYRYSADVDWCIRVMREASERGLRLMNLHAVVVNYLDGGMTVKNHRASLRERFRVMSHHYGLFTTVAMHVWFVIRSVFRR